MSHVSNERVRRLWLLFLSAPKRTVGPRLYEHPGSRMALSDRQGKEQCTTAISCTDRYSSDRGLPPKPGADQRRDYSYLHWKEIVRVVQQDQKEIRPQGWPLRSNQNNNHHPQQSSSISPIQVCTDFSSRKEASNVQERVQLTL